VTKQPDLFDALRTGGASRRSDPLTSKAAALELDASGLYLACLQALDQGPKTSEEIAASSGLNLQSITPRLVPLEEAGLAERTTMRRPGASGRTRIVWAITDKGRQATTTKGNP
jgi:DNA-binding MarR family transcriptional regulator